MNIPQRKKGSQLKRLNTCKVEGNDKLNTSHVKMSEKADVSVMKDGQKKINNYEVIRDLGE